MTRFLPGDENAPQTGQRGKRSAESGHPPTTRLPGCRRASSALWPSSPGLFCNTACPFNADKAARAQTWIPVTASRPAPHYLNPTRAGSGAAMPTDFRPSRPLNDPRLTAVRRIRLIQPRRRGHKTRGSAKANAWMPQGLGEIGYFPSIKRYAGSHVPADLRPRRDTSARLRVIVCHVDSERSKLPVTLWRQTSE